MRPASCLPLLVVLVALSGCGGGGSGTEPFREQQIVAPSGGTYAFRGGRIALTVPFNGVAENTPVSIQSPPSVAVPVDANIVRDTTFQFSPITFGANVTVACGYDAGDLPSGVAETRLRVVRLNNNVWTQVTATQDAQNDRFTFSTNSLGVYAVRIAN